MTQTELKKREAALASAGYHKSRNTSSTNDYSWFKTVRNPQDHEDWLYMIEWRVWSWVKYIDRDPSLAKNPYSMELCILANIPEDAAPRMTYPDILSIEQAESLAKDFYELINRHDSKYPYHKLQKTTTC